MLDPGIFRQSDRKYVAYLLNTIKWKRVCWDADRRGYSRLKTAYLRRVIPAEPLSRIIDKLESIGVIEIDHRFVPGKKSKGYRLAPDFWKSKRIICRNSRMIRAVRSMYETEQSTQTPVHRWLDSQLDRVEIDLDRAREMISKMSPADKTRIPVDAYRAILADTCEMIYHGDHRAHADRFGRYHSGITRLAKPLRQCLSVDGHSFINLDVANSQPLIAGILATEFHGSRFRAARLCDRRFATTVNPYRRRLPKVATTTIADDLLEYVELCESGLLYESFLHDGLSRDRVKRALLTAMYGRNHWQDPIKTEIERRFPSLAEMLRRLKQRDYRHAARLMQNVESTVVIHTICGQIMREKPNAPICSIHDSLMTTPPYVDYVREMMIAKFRSLGVTPKIRKECTE